MGLKDLLKKALTGASDEDNRKKNRGKAMSGTGKLSVFLNEFFNGILRVGRDLNLA